ncbi:hypothetical protein [Adhaeribacter aquaticus]|nr:hypothetical protein [Adhaeribacter aquaticus]
MDRPFFWRIHKRVEYNSLPARFAEAAPEQMVWACGSFRLVSG